MSKLCTQMRLEGTSFRASLGRTGMKKRASFEIFVRHIRTTVRKWELCIGIRLILYALHHVSVVNLFTTPPLHIILLGMDPLSKMTAFFIYLNNFLSTCISSL